jgi:DNA-binding NtrC family response regulator
MQGRRLCHNDARYRKRDEDFPASRDVTNPPIWMGMTPGANARTVLIVDDQPDVLWPHAQSLERSGDRVVFAHSAEEALDYVRSHAADALLIDLKMPYVNGMGLLYRLREIRPHVPMAIITGALDVGDETRDELISMGVALYFKPLTLQQFRSIVDRMIGRASPESNALN